MKVLFNLEKTQKRKNQLEQLYESVYCNEHICKYYGSCSKGMCKDYGYNSSYTTKVGKYYDMTIEGVNTKIVFIGKEGPDKQSVLQRPATLAESVKKNSVTLHWLTTYKMLSDMLNGKYKYHNSTYPTQPCICLQCFTLTNEYKCAFKTESEQRKEIPNSPVQKGNCLKILKEEIKILDPTIIVIQNENLKAKDIFTDSIKVDDCISNNLYKTRYFGTDCYVVQTYHPSFRSGKGNWISLKHPEFITCVEYLRKIGFLPNKNFDVCEYLNKNISNEDI